MAKQLQYESNQKDGEQNQNVEDGTDAPSIDKSQTLIWNRSWYY